MNICDLFFYKNYYGTIFAIVNTTFQFCLFFLINYLGEFKE